MIIVNFSITSNEYDHIILNIAYTNQRSLN
jgi:hypothetical protein